MGSPPVVERGEAVCALAVEGLSAVAIQIFPNRVVIGTAGLKMALLVGTAGDDRKAAEGT